MLSRQQRQIIDAKNPNKSAILIYCSAIIKRVREMVTSNMRNKFGRDA